MTCPRRDNGLNIIGGKGAAVGMVVKCEDVFDAVRWMALILDLRRKTTTFDSVQGICRGLIR
jgi:hypothetical protein